MMLWKKLRLAVRRRNWKALKRTLWTTAYGLTHLRCRSCGGYKGLDTWSICGKCKMENLRQALRCENCGCLPWYGGDCACECHREEVEECTT